MTQTPTVHSAVPLVELPPGLAFDRYTIIERIGSGGMGVVYKALHTGLNRTVAIKVLNAEAAADPEFVERFQREARVMASMESHPNVVQVFDCGTLPTGQPYLAMEYLSGKTLEAVLLEAGKLAPDEALRTTDMVLAGLKEAHAAGVVHRDVKPANVFVGKTVKVLDFGLATGQPLLHRATSAGATETRPMGTPCYVSPEQAQGKAVGPTSDLYSVGIMLYELLSGDVPFPLKADATGPEIEKVLRQHLEERPTPLLDVVDGVPKNLSDFVAKLLSKDPARRCVSAEVARAEIRQILEELREFRTIPGKMTDSPMTAKPLHREAPPGSAPKPAAAAQEAEAAPKHVATAKIDRTAPSPSTDKLLADAGLPKKKSRAWLAVAALLLLVVAAVAIPLATSKPEVPAEPVKKVEATKPPPPVEAVKAPEPRAPEKVAEAETSPDPDIAPLPNLPKKEAAPKKHPKDRYVVEGPKCVPDAAWRAERIRDLQQLGKFAAQSNHYDEWEKLEPRLTKRVAEAGPAECGDVLATIDSLTTKFKPDKP